MEYNKSVGGAWVDADNIKTGQKITIVSECTKQESTFKDKEGNAKVQNVAKVRTEGSDESMNMRFNWTTIFALIDAFGKDSKDWVNKPLTAHALEAMVGDTMRTIIYLIPEGFELFKNDEKKMEIRKIGGATVPEAEEEIKPEDIPF